MSTQYETGNGWALVPGSCPKSVHINGWQAWAPINDDGQAQARAILRDAWRWVGGIELPADSDAPVRYCWRNQFWQFRADAERGLEAHFDRRTKGGGGVTSSRRPLLFALDVRSGELWHRRPELWRWTLVRAAWAPSWPMRRAA